MEFLLLALLTSGTLSTYTLSSSHSKNDRSFSSTRKYSAPVCAKEESVVISKYFVSLKYDKSNCPSRNYLLDLRNNDPDNHKVFIDIGANKGYNFALMYSLWMPHLRINGMKWFEMAIKDSSLRHEDLYGQCQDYKENLDDPRASEIPKQDSVNLKMLAIDLSSTSLQLIRDISLRLTDELNTPLHIKTLHTAMSNTHGTTTSGKCIHSFYEKCRISSSGRLTIPVTTIDHLWPQLPSLLNLTEEEGRVKTKEGSLRKGRSKDEANGKESRVDILMIDTEGYDPLVLAGGESTLSNRLVRLLIFEYHGDCPWPLTALHDVTKKLHSYGYVCYFEGQNRLWRLSGCWSPLYECHAWSNVLCVDHQDPWAEILDRYRVRNEDALNYFNSTTTEQQHQHQEGEEEMKYVTRKPKNCTSY
jgi:hypothetical protein